MKRIKVKKDIELPLNYISEYNKKYYDLLNSFKDDVNIKLYFNVSIDFFSRKNLNKDDIKLIKDLYDEYFEKYNINTIYKSGIILENIFSNPFKILNELEITDNKKYAFPGFNSLFLQDKDSFSYERFFKLKLLFQQYIHHFKNTLNYDFKNKLKNIYDNLDEHIYNDEIILRLSENYSNLDVIIINLKNNDIKIEDDTLIYKNIQYSIQLLYSKIFNLSINGIKNLIQSLKWTYQKIDIDETILFDDNNQEIGIYVIERKKFKDMDYPYYSSNYFQSNHWIQLFVKNTENDFNIISHDYISPKYFSFITTFYIWRYRELNRIYHERYVISGGSVKAVYQLRDSKDIDFILYDIDNEMEKNGIFYPKFDKEIDIFSDFGKTYYSNEDYYLPANPELYNDQKEFKENQRKQKKVEKGPFCLTCDFSASGLKIGRYFPIYRTYMNQFLLNKGINKKLKEMDDLIFDETFYIYRFGFKHLKLECEVLRDCMKDIDLTRVSKKQILDFHLIHKCYYHYFKSNNINLLKLNQYINLPLTYKPNILLAIDHSIYHGELYNTGYDVIIRKAPLFLSNIVYELMKEGNCLLIEREKENDIENLNMEKNSLIEYNHVLLTSLPAIIKEQGKIYEPTYWNYLIDEFGNINIFFNKRMCSLEQNCFMKTNIIDKYYLAGELKILNMDEKTIKIVFCVDKDNWIKLLENKYETKFVRKYYENMINIFKNIIQIHKQYDALCNKKLSIEFSKESLFDR
jgi:hypothetical protein